MNDLDMDLERAIQMRRGIGQDQYVDGLETPLGIGQPGAAGVVVGGAAGHVGNGWNAAANAADRSDNENGSKNGGDPGTETFFFYPVVLSMLLTVLVVFVFVKLRGFLLFRRLLSLFVSS